MKAITYTKYGPPEVLQLRDVNRPTPGENEVLVGIRATAINDYDWSMVRGKPYLYRLMYGLIKPKYTIPGMELAGTVESLGANVASLKVGDDVYGDISGYGFGSFAEYICINQKALVKKPKAMSFEAAAAVSHASMLAFQGLIDAGKIQKSEKVLINGAGGGVGTFGLQFARLYDAEVTGVDSGDKLKMMESLGFDHIIDYKKEDFTKTGRRYDLILDTKTTRSPEAYLRSLNPGGRYVTVGGLLPRLLQLLSARLLGWKNLHIVSLKPNKDLEMVHRLYEEGKIKPVLDGPYALEDIPRLLSYFGEGRHHGKVVVAIHKNPKK